MLNTLGATATATELVISAEGRHLSNNAGVLVDGEFVPPAGTGGVPPDDPTVTIEGKEPELDGAESGFKKATLTIAKKAAAKPRKIALKK